MNNGTSTTRPIDSEVCLVTGSAGFTGRHLVQALLDRGCTVHGVDRADASTKHPDLRWFQGDVRDPGLLRRACTGVDTIFHTASLIETVTFAPSRFADRVRAVNVEGTKALLEAAVRAGVKRFVHTSSVITAWGGGGTLGNDESIPYSDRQDLYSSTKVAQERLVLDADGVGGLLTCAIRPGGIYGPGERNLMVGPMVEALKQGIPVITFGDGKARIDYTYIDNVVDAQLRAAERLVEESPVRGQAYFITDGQPINTGAFSLKLVENMGLRAKNLRVPAPVARTLAAVGEGVFRVFGRPKPVLSIMTVKMCEVDSHFSIGKAKRDLGYEPLVDTNEGLRRTAIEARQYYDSL
ncbi:MAG: NAD-dependent epimerase/dehydratase family protein [Myxococcota bacterium]